MDNLERSLDYVADASVSVVKNSVPARKILNSYNSDGSKQEIEDTLVRMAEKTGNMVRQRLQELVDRAELKTKYEKLEDLTRDSEAVNQELGSTHGYRPINPNVDTAMHVRTVFDKLRKPINHFIEEIDYEIKEKENEKEVRGEVLNELTSLVSKKLAKAD